MLNKEFLKRASLPSTESILLQVQLGWAVHVMRMEDVCMPKAVFFSELQEGKRDCSASRQRYKEQLRKQLAQVGISRQLRQQEASDQSSWYSRLKKSQS